jgi:hypothetical protein
LKADYRVVVPDLRGYGTAGCSVGRDAGPAGQRPGSRVKAIMRLSLESKPGLGLHDSQQVSNMQVSVKLRLLFSRQSSGFRPFRQLRYFAAGRPFPKFTESKNSAASGDNSSFIRGLLAEEEGFE